MEVAKESKEAKEAKEAKDVKEAKEEAKSPMVRGKEEDQAPQEPVEPETEEEIEKKDRFQELQVYLKKYNKRFPDAILIRDFPKLLRLRGHNPTEKEIADYKTKYMKVDRDPDGLIENKAFFEILEERTKSPDTPDELKKAFLLLADKDGKLLKEELRYHLRTMGEPIEEKEVKKFLELATDPSNDKYVDIDLIVQTLFKVKK